MKKRLAMIFALLLSFMVVLSACGTSNNATDKTKTEKKQTAQKGTEQDLLKKVKADGKILIGTEGTYPPFTFHEKMAN
jgi:cystine transport system substrate-binding protein